MVGGGKNGADIVGLALGQLAVALGFQQFGITEDDGQRRPQLIAHIAHEFRFQAVCCLEGFGPVAQGRFHSPRCRHIGKGDQRVPIRQRVGQVSQHGPVRPAHFARGRLACASGRIGDVGLDTFPDLDIVEQRHTGLHHDRIVRLVLQQLVRKAPQPFERLVEQLQASIAAKHGNRLVQIVQRRGLRLHDRIELGLQFQLAGNVLEQQ